MSYSYMTPQEFDDLLDRYTKGKCTEKEQHVVNQWFNSIGKDITDKNEIEALKALTPRKEAIEASLWSKINPAPASKQTVSFNYFSQIAAAIAILAVVVPATYYLLKETGIAQQLNSVKIDRSAEDSFSEIIVNSEDQSKKITLEDGSEVTLKPNSEIRFAKNFTNSKREVYLTGEAFFRVMRDEQRPFFVYSNEVVTKVLGTCFNVKAYTHDKEVTVAVKSGKVSVYPQEIQEPATLEMPASAVILTPNQKVVYNRENEKVLKQLIEKPEIILPEPTLFKMSYDGAPVTKIFAVLEENYGVDIEYDEEVLSACVLTTSMSDEGLYERIEVICKAINAKYTITDAVIKISSRGCL